ncbi:MAG: 3-hydroxyacyl-CoA dehydrogenase family protein, partial [Arenicellales bacterium]
GFYHYKDKLSNKAADQNTMPASTPAGKMISVHGDDALSEKLVQTLKRLNYPHQQIVDSSWTGLQINDAQLRLSNGLPASYWGGDVAVFDWPVSGEENIALAWSISSTSSKQWQKDAEIWLSMLGFIPKKIADTPALVVARTIAMLINEAADVVQQGVCTAAAVDAAMKLGVNYPKGPFEWLADWNAQSVIEVLDNLDHYYRGERYRASPWLRHLVWRESKT